MASGERRGVTRGYAVGLIGAVTILSLALLVAAWGMLSLATGLQPVRTDGVPFAVGPIVVALSMALLISQLWTTVVALLRGRRPVPLAQMVIAGFGAFLVWCLGGMLAELTAAETWLSPFAVLLAVIWALAPLLLWLVLSRRVYSGRRPPRWYWENHPAPGDLQYPDHPVAGDGDGPSGDRPDSTGPR